ncbi:MAG: PLDc N-terminal domain-containing protein [Candidatus Aenigmarchaeota archaeon]|nr:PLDc N-terminal domain-containing protein [Candidatus Aenigmarchaeota archaeon]
MSLLEGLALLFGVFFLLAMILGFASLAFTVWMLIDCIQRDFKDKLLWIIIIFIGGPIGALVYYFAVRKKMMGKSRKSTDRKKSSR